MTRDHAPMPTRTALLLVLCTALAACRVTALGFWEPVPPDFRERVAADLGSFEVYYQDSPQGPRAVLLHRKDSGLRFNPRDWTAVAPGQEMALVDTALRQGNRVEALQPKEKPFLGYAISRTIDGATVRRYYQLIVGDKPDPNYMLVEIRQRMGSSRGN